MKKAIILASFGTSYLETRSKTIERIENEARMRFSNFTVVAAYTSNIVRSILKKRDGLIIASPQEAVDNLLKQGFTEIYIQPTHIIPGAEYDKLKIQNCILGKTLLHEGADFEKIIAALELRQLSENTAAIFMGHGSYHAADKFYDILERKIQEKNYNNFFIGTVEGTKTIQDILPHLEKKKIRDVYLYPFMFVAGDHAQNDMAGDEAESWKQILKQNNYTVYPVLRGLGESSKIRELIFTSLENTITNHKNN